MYHSAVPGIKKHSSNSRSSLPFEVGMVQRPDSSNLIDRTWTNKLTSNPSLSLKVLPRFWKKQNGLKDERISLYFGPAEVVNDIYWSRFLLNWSLTNSSISTSTYSFRPPGLFEIQTMSSSEIQVDCCFKVENVIFIDRFNGYVRSEGALHITVTHIFFVDYAKRYEMWMQTCLIGAVERLPLTATGAPLVIRGRDFRVACFLIRKDRECQEVFETLTRMTQSKYIHDLPCFRYPPPGFGGKQTEGWNLHDLRRDFARMGVPNDVWVETDLNKHYQICDTYPNLLFVPTTASTPTLLGSSKFRSRGRLPVLTFLHPNGKSALCRSSQPLSGFSSKCLEDQLMVKCIRLANPVHQLMYVVDTRPPLNALGNRAQGKGYEDVNVYQDIILRFIEIPNIHAVRSSLETLIKAYQDPRITVENLNHAVDKSSWLRNLRRIVDAAYFIASKMEEGFSLLVHCSDGWDRTAQVCALAQIIIDPYYRTIEGLRMLIEKDWLHFGHKFTERFGLTTSVDAREQSPIFTQFLDSLRHLVHLLPSHFEYNSRLLVELHDASVSALYGTFVGCCEKDRLDLKLAEKTCSMWVEVEKKRDRFLNPLYHPPPKLKTSSAADKAAPYSSLMLPSFVTAPQLFSVWRELFLRKEWRIPNVSGVIEDSMKDLQSRTRVFNGSIDLLRLRVQELGKLLGKSDAEIRKLLVQPQVPAEEKIASNRNGDREVKMSIGNGTCYNSAPDLQLNSNPQDLIAPVSKSDADWRKNLPRLTAYGLTKEINSVRTATDPMSVHPTTPCPVCNVLLLIRSSMVHCVHCGKLVCSNCYEGKREILSGVPSSIKLNLCKPCIRSVRKAN